MKKPIVILFLAFLLLPFTSCEIELNEKTYDIKYEITGSADTVSITMRNANGDTEQLDDVALSWFPWSTSFKVTVKRYHYFSAYVSAQNQGQSGFVTVKIYKDGKELKTDTSYGAYPATASKSIDY